MFLLMGAGLIGGFLTFAALWPCGVEPALAGSLIGASLAAALTAVIRAAWSR